MLYLASTQPLNVEDLWLISMVNSYGFGDKLSNWEKSSEELKAERDMVNDVDGTKTSRYWTWRDYGKSLSRVDTGTPFSWVFSTDASSTPAASVARLPFRQVGERAHKDSTGARTPSTKKMMSASSTTCPWTTVSMTSSDPTITRGRAVSRRADDLGKLIQPLLPLYDGSQYESDDAGLPCLGADVWSWKSTKRICRPDGKTAG